MTPAQKLVDEIRDLQAQEDQAEPKEEQQPIHSEQDLPFFLRRQAA